MDLGSSRTVKSETSAGKLVRECATLVPEMNSSELEVLGAFLKLVGERLSKETPSQMPAEPTEDLTFPSVPSADPTPAFPQIATLRELSKRVSEEERGLRDRINEAREYFGVISLHHFGIDENGRLTGALHLPESNEDPVRAIFSEYLRNPPCLERLEVALTFADLEARGDMTSHLSYWQVGEKDYRGDPQLIEGFSRLLTIKIIRENTGALYAKVQCNLDGIQSDWLNLDRAIWTAFKEGISKDGLQVRVRKSGGSFFEPVVQKTEVETFVEIKQQDRNGRDHPYAFLTYICQKLTEAAQKIHAEEAPPGQRRAGIGQVNLGLFRRRDAESSQENQGAPKLESLPFGEIPEKASSLYPQLNNLRACRNDLQEQFRLSPRAAQFLSELLPDLEMLAAGNLDLTNSRKSYNIKNLHDVLRQGAFVFDAAQLSQENAAFERFYHSLKQAPSKPQTLSPAEAGNILRQFDEDLATLASLPKASEYRKS